MPSGRCVQAVAPNGVSVQISQYFAAGITLTLSVMPASASLVAHGFGDRLVPRAVGVADVDRDLEALLAGLREQRLGALDVARERRQREILRMDRRDVVVLADVAALREDERLDRGVVERLGDRLPHLLVGERLQVDTELAGTASARCGSR